MTKGQKRKVVMGICPECKVRDGDSSKKRLYRCSHCDRYFCKRHLPPRLVIMRNKLEEIKDPVLKDKLEEEWRKPNGHPCWQWTQKYFEGLKSEESKSIEELHVLLNKLKDIKGKEDEEKSNLASEIEEAGICEYHLCKKKTKVYKCQYCGKYFCEQHLKPLPPLAPRFDAMKHEDYLLMEVSCNPPARL